MVVESVTRLISPAFAAAAAGSCETRRGGVRNNGEYTPVSFMIVGPVPEAVGGMYCVGEAAVSQ
jgi:hypothetical protein